MKYFFCCLLLLSINACSSLTLSSGATAPGLEYPGDPETTLEELRNVNYEDGNEAEDDPRFSITPHYDDTFKHGIYIPRDLDECYRELDSMLHPDAKIYLQGYLTTLTENEKKLFKVNMGHMCLGLYLRNYWGLWEGSRLAQYFAAMKITHPDDMSNIIIDSYKSYLLNKPFNLQGTIKKYREYWRMIQEKEMAEDGLKPREPPDAPLLN
jgi:hypothetical protein